MNLVTNNQNTNTLKMTSLQIAEMLDKRHDTVRTSIERLMNRGVIAVTSLTEASFQDTLGRTQTTNVYEFEGEAGKRDSIIAIAQLSPQHTAILVDRWIELEKQVAAPQLPNFNNPVEAARAWANEVEQKQAIEYKLEQAAPKINHYDTVVDRYNLMTATQVGQKLGMTANKLNKHLEELGAYNRTVKRGRAFQQWFIDNNYGVMKEANKGYSQALFTSKGQAYIVEQLTFNKVVSEEVTERLVARSNHTANVINRIDSLLIH